MVVYADDTITWISSRKQFLTQPGQNCFCHKIRQDVAVFRIAACLLFSVSANPFNTLVLNGAAVPVQAAFVVECFIVIN